MLMFHVCVINYHVKYSHYYCAHNLKRHDSTELVDDNLLYDNIYFVIML